MASTLIRFFPFIIQNCGALPDYKPKRWSSWAAVSDVWDRAANAIVQRLKSIRWKAKAQTDRFFINICRGVVSVEGNFFFPFLMLHLRQKMARWRLWNRKKCDNPRSKAHWDFKEDYTLCKKPNMSNWSQLERKGRMFLTLSRCQPIRAIDIHTRSPSPPIHDVTFSRKWDATSPKVLNAPPAPIHSSPHFITFTPPPPPFFLPFDIHMADVTSLTSCSKWGETMSAQATLYKPSAAFLRFPRQCYTSALSERGSESFAGL